MSNRSFRLQPDLDERLTAEAARLRRSKNWVVNEALRGYFAAREDEERRWRETLAAIDSVDRGDGLSGEAVLRWIETWGSGDETPPPRGD